MIQIIVARTKEDFESCFKIRTQVFVDEQRVPEEMERDEYEETALHFLTFVDGQAVGTARVIILEDGESAKIGRVAILKSRRGLGLGKQLMLAIENANELSHCKRFLLQAQTHALEFYTQLGYTAESSEFLDAGIPHREMNKSKTVG
jgi:predicted GNAT family N-acyltransferase